MEKKIMIYGIIFLVYQETIFMITSKETIEILNNMKPLPPLEQCDDLNVKVPKNVTKWSKREVFADLLGEKKANLAEHYNNYQFQFDIGSADPTICAIMQILLG